MKIVALIVALFSLPVAAQISESFVGLKGPDDTQIGNIQDSIKVVESLKAGGLYANLSVGTTAVEVKVGGSRLANRRLITIMPTDATLYWGYNCSVTTATGTPLFKNQLLVLHVDDSAPVCLISGTAGRNARITESP